MADSNTDFSLRNKTAFLVFAASKNYNRLFSEELDKIDVTFLEALILLALHEREVLTISSLCSTLCLDPGSASPYVKGLCAKKLLFKRHNKRDKRSYVVKLTDAGRNTVARILEIEAAVTETLSSGGEFEASINGQLRELLAKMEKAEQDKYEI